MHEPSCLATGRALHSSERPNLPQTQTLSLSLSSPKQQAPPFHTLCFHPYSLLSLSLSLSDSSNSGRFSQVFNFSFTRKKQHTYTHISLFFSSVSFLVCSWVMVVVVVQAIPDEFCWIFFHFLLILLFFSFSAIRVSLVDPPPFFYNSIFLSLNLISQTIGDFSGLVLVSQLSSRFIFFFLNKFDWFSPERILEKLVFMKPVSLLANFPLMGYFLVPLTFPLWCSYSFGSTVITQIYSCIQWILCFLFFKMEISGNLLHESSVSRMNLVALLKKKKNFRIGDWAICSIEKLSWLTWLSP